MTLVVLDASALIYAVSSRAPAAAVLRRRLVEHPSQAPHLIDAEVGNVLRRHVLRDELPPSVAGALLGDAATLVDVRYETSATLGEAAWTLRDDLTFYDALYVRHRASAARSAADRRREAGAGADAPVRRRAGHGLSPRRRRPRGAAASVAQGRGVPSAV